MIPEQSEHCELLAVYPKLHLQEELATDCGGDEAWPWHWAMGAPAPLQ